MPSPDDEVEEEGDGDGDPEPNQPIVCLEEDVLERIV